MDSTNIISEQAFKREETLYSALCLGVKDYFDKTAHKKAVMGLSGGIDSSLTACIAVDALGKENVWGITMPSEISSEHSVTDSEKLAQNLGISLKSLPIEELVNNANRSLKPIFKDAPPNVAEENIQARIRGILLMAISNKYGWLVLTTGNKTELALGYCTLYGDMNGGLAVISDLSKQDVYAISNWVNESAGYDRIPEDCITKPPSAELAPHQRDPFDYDVVSPIVDSIVEDRLSIDDLLQKGEERSLVLDLAGRIRINEYKRRQAAPGLRVTSKAFGIGRRYPIINHYKK
jgi:NAD+ synthase (glutamine-hydrolysing)